MNIAFYAPLKSPHDPVPSGDRQIARNIIAALKQAGINVDLASNLRTYEGKGDIEQQTTLQKRAEQNAAQLIATYRSGKQSLPDAWLTYHSYHKAPDWIGPHVAAALNVPYCLIEASVSPKEHDGPWSRGHAQACHAAASADLILGINPRDRECVAPLMAANAMYSALPPFLDTGPTRLTCDQSAEHRATLSNSHNIDPSKVWLLAVGMMRNGDKAKSFELLAKSLRHLTSSAWHVIVVGDGPAKQHIQELFCPLKKHITLLGRRSPDELTTIYSSADILTWPAINEALGMTFLEAAACGLPSVAGHTDGVASIVRHNETGVIAPAGDTVAFAQNIQTLIDHPEQRRRLGEAARLHVETHHGIETASRMLEKHLRQVITRRSPAHAP